ncbi:MAG: cyclase family protein [Dehalococcoidia bacterium]|nr:cyclase family protein [Dehalococcoidia bacterium]MCB9486141.1 cyclase family protein [Thermoflexaceae bacterium]
MAVPERLPTFDELPVVDGAPPQSAWWLFGKDDQVGKFNLQTAERVVEAAGLVRKGSVFALNWELELPSPTLYGRGAVRQTILGSGPGRDDVLDNFFPQASSQWDSLVHVGHPEHGFYNGVKESEITGKPGTKNGIEHWARRGLAGRGVLLDMERYLANQGTPLDCGETYRFSVEELEACRAAQGVEIRAGDMLIIHTGWIGWYHEQDLATRRMLANTALLKTPGVAAGEAMARHLWNLQVCSVASDCPAFEAWPPTPATGGFLHQYIIGLFGMGIGEMWDLRALAADCAEDGVYEFLFTSAPLNKLGGVGSPPNALALK